MKHIWNLNKTDTLGHGERFYYVTQINDERGKKIYSSEVYDAKIYLVRL